jgi:membrane-bound lytic murein transglycosylase D
VYLPVNNQQFLDLKIKNDQQKFSEDQVAVNKDLGFPVLVRVTQAAAKSEPIFYEINEKKGILAVQGDTQESIAERAGVNLKRFLKYNDLNENDRIIPNEVYYLKKKDRRAVVAYHTVEGYETLWKISQMYGIQLEDLMAKNRITQIQRLQKGRLLWLIETRPEGQSVEYVQTQDDKFTPIIDKTVVSEPKKQPVIPPVTKKPIIPQNTQPEITVFESKTEQPVVTTTKPPIIKETQPSTPIVIAKPITSPSTPVLNPPVVTSNPPANTGKTNNKIIKNHTVEAKQTYYSISRIYNMSVDELYSLNDVYSGTPLRVGQNLKVYLTSSSPITGATKVEDKIAATYTYPVENKPVQTPITTTQPTTTTTTIVVREIVTSPADNMEVASTNPTPILTTSSSNKPTTTTSTTAVYTPPPVSKPFSPAPENTQPNYKIIHTIQAGETIYRVSKIYGVSVENVKNWNKLTQNTVEIGQELVILGGNTKPNVSELTQTNLSNNYQYHTLKAGETVFRVSQIYGVTVDEVVKWNNIKNFAVSVGQKLVIKK